MTFVRDIEFKVWAFGPGAKVLAIPRSVIAESARADAKRDARLELSRQVPFDLDGWRYTYQERYSRAGQRTRGDVTEPVSGADMDTAKELAIAAAMTQIEAAADEAMKDVPWDAIKLIVRYDAALVPGLAGFDCWIVPSRNPHLVPVGW